MKYTIKMIDFCGVICFEACLFLSLETDKDKIGILLNRAIHMSEPGALSWVKTYARKHQLEVAA